MKDSGIVGKRLLPCRLLFEIITDARREVRGNLAYRNHGLCVRTLLEALFTRALPRELLNKNITSCIACASERLEYPGLTREVTFTGSVRIFRSYFIFLNVVLFRLEFQCVCHTVRSMKIIGVLTMFFGFHLLIACQSRAYYYEK